MPDDWEPSAGLVAAVWLLVAVAILLSVSGCAPKPADPVVAVAPEEAVQQPEPPDTTPSAARRYRSDLVRNARLVWGLDAPVATFAGQIHQESGWRADARSHVGAQGMAQFMPKTAEWICGAYPDLPAGCDAMSPAWALRALVQYDKHLYDRLAVAGAECGRMWASLRSYNGGLGHWLKEARLAADPTNREGVDAQCGRASRSAKHCPENLGYPKRIIERHQSRYLSWGRGVCT